MTATKRTPEIVAEILERMSNGEPLVQICRSDRDRLPSRWVWRDWCNADPELLLLNNQARDDGYDVIAAQMLHIADTPVEGVEIVEKPTGIEVRKGDMLGHRKLQIDTREKLLAKWDHRRYGNKLAVGGDPDAPPIKTDSTVTLTAEEAYKRMLGDK